MNQRKEENDHRKYFMRSNSQPLNLQSVSLPIALQAPVYGGGDDDDDGGRDDVGGNATADDGGGE